MAILGASLRYINEERFQCFSKSFKTDMQLDLHVKRNNCESIITNKKGYNKFDNILYNSCFCNFFNPQTQSIIVLSNNLKKHGIIPTHIVGNNFVMSNKLYQAHNIIQSYFFEIEKIEMDKMKQKMKG